MQHDDNPAEAGPAGTAESEAGLFRRFRCVLIGLVMAGLIGLAAPWWNGYLSRYGLFSDHNNGGVTFLIVVVGLLFNFVLGLVWRRARLSARELLFVTAMMFASGAVAVTGTVGHLIPAIASPHYRQQAGAPEHFRPPPGADLYRERGGTTLLNPRLFPLDPDDRGTVAITKFWEGVPEREPAPMKPWVEPILLWGIMLVSVYAMSVSVMSIMRKQWVEHEHLSYPLGQVPAEMCHALAEPRAPKSVFRSRAFWLGACFVFLGSSVGSIYFYATGNQGFELGISHAMWFTFTGGVERKLEIMLNPLMMGFAFLIPCRVAFSVWFMVLAAWGWNTMCQVYGIGLDVPKAYGGDASLQYLIMGSLIVFVGANLWQSRRHLVRVLACALGRGEPDYDRAEPTSYRTALVVLVASIVAAVMWLRFAGVAPVLGLLYMLAMFIIFYGIARVIAQCGLPTAGAPTTPETMVVTTIGARNMSFQSVTGIYSQLSWHQNMRQVPTVGATHGAYLAGRSRGLFWAMLLAMAVTYLVGCFTQVQMCYRMGGALTMDNWIYRVSSFLPWLWSTVNITQQAGPAYGGLLWGGAGAAIMALIVLAQRTFFWWPLHPVGIIMSTPHLVRVAWFSIALTWAAKVAVLKLGGHRAYRAGRQFAIGALVGTFMAGGFWTVVRTVVLVALRGTG